MSDRRRKSAYPWRGASPNASVRLDEPSPPGAWVDPTRCVCGARYADFRCSEVQSFGEAADLYRRAARAAGVPGDGFRSAGPVLWRWRVAKLDEWYREHEHCGEGGDVLDDEGVDSDDDGLDGWDQFVAKHGEPPF